MNKNPIKDYLENRSSIFELFIVAIFLGFSVSIIVSSITLIQGFKPLFGISLGVIVFSISFLIFLNRIKSSLRREKTIKGFLLYEPSSNNIQNVPRYDFSTTISEYISAAFLENPALNTQWEKEPLKDTYIFDEQTHSFTYQKNFSHILLCQAIEYYILSRTSLYLTDYFNNILEEKSKYIKTYIRNEVPEILLSNRFLELFSRPMNERTLFNDTSFSDKIVSGFSNGAYYERFDLTLPKNSEIKRVSDECVEIETSRFKFQINVIFRNTNTVFPDKFEKYYLGIDELRTPLEVIINFKVEFKFRSFLLIRGWKYYEWIDLILQKFEEKISKDAFFEKINWETALTVLQGIDKKNVNIDQLKN